MAVKAEADLIRFDIDILVAIALTNKERGERPKGVDISDFLERNAGRPINNGRLYPRLNKLCADGYVAKAQKNKRSNLYALTDKSREVIQMRADLLNKAAEEVAE